MQCQQLHTAYAHSATGTIPRETPTAETAVTKHCVGIKKML